MHPRILVEADGGGVPVWQFVCAWLRLQGFECDFGRGADGD